jgi:hypothetical protein
MAEVIINRQKHFLPEQLNNQIGNKNDDINNLCKIVHQNIRGIKGKINELIISLLNEEPSVICLTEQNIVKE